MYGLPRSVNLFSYKRQHAAMRFRLSHVRSATWSHPTNLSERRLNVIREQLMADDRSTAAIAVANGPSPPQGHRDHSGSGPSQDEPESWQHHLTFRRQFQVFVLS